MYVDDELITYEESLILQLRALYKQHGFKRYKMSKFEEYDLYAANKDYLVSEGVISFTDTNGKLMALKPDVTLSLVRNYPIPDEGVARVCYNENVYRVTKNTGSFQELMQVGVECLGQVDAACVADTLLLACESLKVISPAYRLVINDLDVVTLVLYRLGLAPQNLQRVMRYMNEKNLHELTRFCESAGANAGALQDLITLLSYSGEASDTVAWLRSRGFGGAAADNLSRVLAQLDVAGAIDKVRVDFSSTDDISYYNGVIFKGYVLGVPTAVLSGGQYDNLMRKLDKFQQAIGFAVYTDNLRSDIAAAAAAAEIEANEGEAE